MRASRAVPRPATTSLTWAVGALVCALVAVLGVAQQFPLSQLLGSNFLLPEFYDAPHERQMKSLLQGEEALPQGDGRILIRNLQLETFRRNGAGEFVLQADDCVYDTERREAASSGPLEMKTTDGRFFTEGEGFRWREDESILTISNRVHTVIRSGQAEPSA